MLFLTSPMMRGEEVLLCQRLLNASGAELCEDGIFGEKTQAAVTAFQTAHSLNADGIVGEKTWHALRFPNAAPKTDAPSQNAVGLADYCLSRLGDVYAWGGFGEDATEENIRRLDHLGPDRAVRFLKKQHEKGVTGLKLFDCSGLPSSYLKRLGIVSQKRNCNHLYAMCTPIQKAELMEGDLVFRRKNNRSYHVGVYVGRGRVVEARGRDYGVVLSGIDEIGSWNAYGRLL